jgi:CubicO group peptidase (beta-lactamase class C family)
MRLSSPQPFFQSIVAGILFLFCNECATAQSTIGLDSILLRMVQKRGEPGIAVAVIQKDSLVYSRGFGYRDFQRRLPVTCETVFPVGSCTKAMTAALIGCLSPKITLEAPVRNYLPECKFYNEEMNERITVRDLLCHRSGLPRHEFSWYFLAAGARDSMIQRLAYLEPNARIGEKWQYNNWGYFLLGMIGEKVSGLPYEAAIQQYILGPLQMRRSYFCRDSLLQDKEAALGYKTVNNKIRQVPYHATIQLMAPAGGLNSTVLDMARWLSCWINGKAIIPASFRAQAISSQIVTKAALPMKDQPDSYLSNYGFGWMLSGYRGHYRVEHGGNIDGFTSSACFFPTDSLGIIVLCNRDGSELPALVRNTIADYFLQLPAISRSTASKQSRNNNEDLSKKTSTTEEVIPPTHTSASYAGSYEHPGYGHLTISQQGDSLFAHLGAHTWWLRPQQYDAFRGVEFSIGEVPDLDQATLLLQFQMHPNGYIESLSIPFEPTLAPIRFMKQVLSQPEAQQKFKTYTGCYELAGDTISVSLNENGKLNLLISATEYYQLLPIEENVFILSGEKGSSVRFFKDRKHAVTGFLLQLPKETLKATLIK